MLSKNSYEGKLIKEVRDKYQELNDRGNYSKSNVLLCEACLKNENYDAAFSAVNEEEFLQVCAENSLVKANREFLIGEISSRNEKLNLPNPFKCYSAAYEIIEDGYITELTWKVLLKLSDIYYKRGNFSKIKDNIFYAKKILYSGLAYKKMKAISRIEFLEKEVS